MSLIHQFMRFFGFESWFGMLITIPFVIYTLIFVFLTVSLFMYENRFFKAPWYSWLECRGYDVTEEILKSIWWWWIGLTFVIVSINWLAAVLGGEGFNLIRILRGVFQICGLITLVLCVLLPILWRYLKNNPDWT